MGELSPGIGLTARQRRVVDFLQGFLADRGFPPTLAEIAAGLGFRSANSAAEHVRRLARKGIVAVTPGVARGLRLQIAPPTAGAAGRSRALAPRPERPPGLLPLIGEVAAGQPILAAAHVERSVEVAPALFSPRADFLLRVRGESMIDAGLLPGDLVAVHRTPLARDGQIAVVRLDDDVTVKRWHTRLRGKRKEVVLEPANAALSPVVVDPARVQVAVEGVVVGLLRLNA